MSKNTPRTISIIPKPIQIVESDGYFCFNLKSAILVSNEWLEIGKFLQTYILIETGLLLDIRDINGSHPRENCIILSINAELTPQGDEGYSLSAAANKIHIKALQPAGIFYGLQTLRQLIQTNNDGTKIIPAVKIQDSPRFAWRGLMLDVGRHFYSVEFVKRFIDLLALHKMNTFHWHLTEDQGWRIEIKKYPRLTEIGSQRAESEQPGGDRNHFDGQPHDGFYTQTEIKEVVAYAASRFITVIPEIELPGHSLGALASYPELGCTGGPYEVQTSWGIKKDVYCAGNEQVYQFLEDVLSEVLKLFPSQVIHIGGDEVPKDRWRDCPKCQATIRKEGLKDEDELQSYFIKRIEKFLNAQ